MNPERAPFYSSWPGWALYALNHEWPVDLLVAFCLWVVGGGFFFGSLASGAQGGNPLAAFLGMGLFLGLAGATYYGICAAARAALDQAGVSVRPVSEEPDVRAVVQRVALGEADAGIAYVTDVAAADGSVEGTDLPEVSSTYPAGVLRGAAQPAAATAFLDLAASPEGQRVLASYGFLPPG